MKYVGHPVPTLSPTTATEAPTQLEEDSVLVHGQQDKDHTGPGAEERRAGLLRTRSHLGAGAEGRRAGCS